MNSSKSLPLDQFAWWFDAICTNDIALVSTALKDPNNRDGLLNGFFTGQKSCPSVAVLIECPASVAVCHGAFDVLSLMMSHNDRLNFVNSAGKNVIHDLIVLSKENPGDEPMFVEYYHKLCSVISAEELRLLLMETTTLLPLEMACFYETMTMAHVILQTRGVYLVKEELVGMTLHRWYDCHHYESLNGKCASRGVTSPIFFLSQMSMKAVLHPSTRELLFSDPIKTWRLSMKKLNIVVVWLWFILRFSLFATFIAYDYLQADIIDVVHKIDIHRAQHKSHGTVRGLVYYTGCVCGLIIIFDFVEFIIARMKYKITSLVRFRSAGNVSLFRITQFFMIIMKITTIVCSSLAVMTKEHMLMYMNILVFSRLLGSVCSCWSLMFFFQLLPSIGVFVISIQHLLKDMASFAAIYILFLFLFTHIFTVFMKTANASNNEDFKDYAKTSYTLFMVMLNMVDLNVYDVRYLMLLRSMHLLFVFVLAVLLINFLIALFSNTVSNIMVNKDIFSEIEHCSIYFTAQIRMSTLLPFVRRFLLLKYANHAFEMVGDRLCIKCTTIVDRALSCKRQQLQTDSTQGSLTTSHL